MLRTMAEWITTPKSLPRRDDLDPTTDRAPDGMCGQIDTGDGLARVDNADLYRRLLRGFRRTHADLEDTLRAAPAPAPSPSWADELLRHLHDLKGLAGNIGAKDLQAAAAQDLHAALVIGNRATVDAADPA
jgi:two-component system, sensor histidine kinase and response regulator